METLHSLHTQQTLGKPQSGKEAPPLQRQAANAQALPRCYTRAVSGNGHLPVSARKGSTSSLTNLYSTEGSASKQHDSLNLHPSASQCPRPALTANHWMAIIYLCPRSLAACQQMGNDWADWTQARRHGGIAVATPTLLPAMLMSQRQRTCTGRYSNQRQSSQRTHHAINFFVRSM
jgi:hypothetical protein